MGQLGEGMTVRQDGVFAGHDTKGVFLRYSEQGEVMQQVNQRKMLRQQDNTQS